MSDTYGCRWWAALLLWLPGAAIATEFTTGSTGTRPLEVPPGQTLQVELPPDGVLHVTTMTVPAGSRLEFVRNEANTPVTILASGAVTIDGTIDVSAEDDRGGPGGYDGGATFGGSHGDGEGSGGGTADGSQPGDRGSALNGTNRAGVLAMPLQGGGGGAAHYSVHNCDVPGGGGGGAILIASDVSISGGNSGRIQADGNSENRCATNTVTIPAGGGAGGTIRLVAPTVGVGTISASSNHNKGIVRVDSIAGRGWNNCDSKICIRSSIMLVDLPALPTVTITSVGGRAITVDELAEGYALVLLPLGADPMQDVTIEAENFIGDVTIYAVLYPEGEPRVVYPVTVNGGTGALVTQTYPIEFGANAVTKLAFYSAPPRP